MIINSINAETYVTINDKKRLYVSLQQQRTVLIDTFNEKQNDMLGKTQLKILKEQKAFKIRYLNDELKRISCKLIDKRNVFEQVNKRTSQKVEMIRQCKDKINKTKETIRLSEKMANAKISNNQSNNMKFQIVQYQKDRIKELNKYVFNLVEIKPKLDDDVLQKSTFTALKDARMTMYINGRWILGNDPVHYMVVKSKLPSNGDYCAYYKEVETKDNEKKALIDHQQSPFSSRSNPNRNEIAAALTYTTQFVNLIAFYSNAVLPYNLPHNKFCSQTLNQSQFTNSVAKLNVNIIYLCLSQLIPVNNLLPKHTLENLYHFLEYFKEMKTKTREHRHSISFPHEIIVLLDEMFDKNVMDELDLDYVPNLLFNDCEEWEKLPNSDEIPMDATNTMSMNQTKSGLIASSTSLISSVTSFFSKRLGGGSTLGGGHTS